jgi:hypothetical protein
MKTLNELRDSIHENAVKHGFYDDEANAFAKACNPDVGVKALKHAFFAQKIALIHSELSGALEADRKGKRAYMRVFLANVTPDGTFDDLLPEDIAFREFISSTVEDELADVITRTLDL